jgi:hypothetical protein
MLVTALVGAAGMLGCAEPVRATLVGLRGCGLEDEELDALRITPRGDFPSSAVNATLVHGGMASIPELPDDAAAITVEGLFGDLPAPLAVGRAPVDADPEGELRMYFAPPDEVCAVNSGVDFREGASIAANANGDIILVGGRDEDGRMLDDVVVTRDDDPDQLVSPLDRGTPAPVTGAALVAVSDRVFALIGGARSDAIPQGTWLAIDLDLQQPVPRGTDVPTLDALGVAVPRGYHAAAMLPDGRVLVTGGCSILDRGSSGPAFGSCLPSKAGVTPTAFFIDPSTDPPTAIRAQELLQPRYDHELLVARDGAVFVIGGRDVNGDGVRTIERTTADSNSWT